MQSWISIFLISFLCFSAKSISSVVLLVKNHKKIVKFTTKTSIGPNCPFQAQQIRKFGFRSFKTPCCVLAPKVSQVWYFWSTKTKSLSNSPPKQVLGPIARFRPKRNTSLVVDIFNLLVVYQRQSISCVILLVNKNQNFVKFTTKTTIGPNCPF